MTLEEWRSSNGLTEAEIARRISQESGQSVSQQAVSRWINEGVMPRLAIVQAIYVVTDGQVDANDLAGIDPAQPVLIPALEERPLHE